MKNIKMCERCIRSGADSHERTAKLVVENENPTQHPGSGEGGTGCISMRGERANESRKTILFAFRKDYRLSFICG